MKTKFSLLIFCLSFVIFSYSQTEKVNQLDGNGKKDGKWILSSAEKREGRKWHHYFSAPPKKQDSK